MNFTAILVVALVVGAVAVPFVAAAPTQAFNGVANGNLLRTQEHDQLRLRDCNYNCTCDGTCDRIRDRTQLRECAYNEIGNGTMNMEQYRYQYRTQRQQP